MGYGRTLSQYRKTEIATAGKMNLVVMCYDKSIQFLKQAKESYQTGDYERKAKLLQKTLDIINELQSCLDFEKGGEIAKNLDAIYNYLTRRLIQGDVEKDLSAFEEAVRFLSELKEAWEEIATREKRNEMPQAPNVEPKALSAQVAA
ncbi:MAG: flagellar export chaperone FliS [Deltaproteobacteria bacterium]|nr:flagellar export chaperone FliS [Deltaproteobacteria bacterium]